MLLFLLLATVTIVTGQTVHQSIEYYVNSAFNKLDSDHDGMLTPVEYRAVFYNDDTNSDGILTLQEFKASSTSGPFASELFATYDHDKDGQINISVLYGLYEIMDTSGDNEISRYEFDTYYTELMERIMKAVQTTAST